jgi:hypothetical protein
VARKRVLSQSSIFGAKAKNRVSEIQRLTDCRTLEKATLRQNPRYCPGVGISRRCWPTCCRSWRHARPPSRARVAHRKRLLTLDRRQGCHALRRASLSRFPKDFDAGSPCHASSTCQVIVRILLVIPSPRDTATVTVLDSRDFWAFNEGMSEA